MGDQNLAPSEGEMVGMGTVGRAGGVQRQKVEGLFFSVLYCCRHHHDPRTTSGLGISTTHRAAPVECI